MEGNRRWLGWIGIGVGALALLVALGGRVFGPQVASTGLSSSNTPQSYAQQNPGPQSSGPQSSSAAPGPNAQQNPGPQSGPGAPGADARRGAGRPRDAGFGLGGRFRFPFRFIGGVFQMSMLALLVVLGVWLIRGRNAGGLFGGGRTEPAQAPPQEPQEPAGESYTDEPRDRE